MRRGEGRHEKERKEWVMKEVGIVVEASCIFGGVEILSDC